MDYKVITLFAILLGSTLGLEEAPSTTPPTDIPYQDAQLAIFTELLLKKYAHDDVELKLPEFETLWTSILGVQNASSVMPHIESHNQNVCSKSLHQTPPCQWITQVRFVYILIVSILNINLLTVFKTKTSF